MLKPVHNPRITQGMRDSPHQTEQIVMRCCSLTCQGQEHSRTIVKGAVMGGFACLAWVYVHSTATVMPIRNSHRHSDCLDTQPRCCWLIGAH